MVSDTLTMTLPHPSYPYLDRTDLAAAARTAVGLTPEAPLGVLRGGSNAVYRVGGLVVRVDPGSVTPDRVDRTQKALRAASLLGQEGLAVAPLEQTPRVAGGHLVTLWPYADPIRDATWVEVAAMLGILHVQGRSMRGTLPAWHPTAFLPPLPASDPMRPALDRLAQQVAQALAGEPGVVVHHDAKRRNLLITPDGPRFIDTDEVTWGPAAVDLAIVVGRAESGDVDLAAVQDAYCAHGAPWPSAEAIEAGRAARQVAHVGYLLRTGQHAVAADTLTALTTERALAFGPSPR